MATRFGLARILALVLCTAIGSADLAGATGLYKGHGRRSQDYDWRWRVNGTIGLHGVEDPWDQFGVNSYPVGGTTDFGVEFSLPRGQSFEVAGGYRWVHDTENVVVTGPGYISRPGNYRYEVDSWSVAGTWRFYTPHPYDNAWVGAGAGFVFDSTLEYTEQIQGGTPYRLRATGTGPEIHGCAGFQGMPDTRLRLGLEVGFRYTWVDFDQGVYGAGNFNGFYLSLRVGLVARD